MTEESANFDADEERTLYRSSPPIRFACLNVMIYSVLIVDFYLFSLIINHPKANEYIFIFSVIVVIQLIFRTVRILRTSLQVTNKRVNLKTGVLWRSFKEMKLADIDIPALKRNARTLGAAIYDRRGNRLSLSSTYNRLEICRVILEATGNDGPRTFSDKLANFNFVHLYLALLGGLTFVLPWGFVIGATLESGDIEFQLYMILLSLICMPIMVGIGSVLGGIVAVLLSPLLLTLEEAVEFLTFEHYPRKRTSSGRFSAWQNSIYEKILGWRYGQIVVLPR